MIEKQCAEEVELVRLQAATKPGGEHYGMVKVLSIVRPWRLPIGIAFHIWVRRYASASIHNPDLNNMRAKKPRRISCQSVSLSDYWEGFSTQNAHLARTACNTAISEQWNTRHVFSIFITRIVIFRHVNQTHCIVTIRRNFNTFPKVLAFGRANLAKWIRQLTCDAKKTSCNQQMPFNIQNYWSFLKEF